MEWASSFGTALGLVLVIEGILPFVSPAGWRRMFTQVSQLRDGQIRFCALLAMLVGGLVLLLTQ